MELHENEFIEPIEGFPDYMVTTEGRVWSEKTHRWLKPTANKRGNHVRLYVSLGRGNKRYVHRLVAETFIPNPNNLPEVDHIDTNGYNNHVDNLRWCTHQNNLENDITQEKIKKNSGYFVEIEEIATGKTVIGYDKAVEEFGVSKQTILNHVKGKVKEPRWRLTGKRFKENS